MAVIRVDALRTVASGGISGSYVALGSIVAKNWVAFRVINNTDGDLFISLDATTNNLFIPKMSFVLYDIATNSPPISQNDNLVISKNTQFYVKQSTAPTTGAVWLEGIYAR
jgi:hypothetical protein